MLVLLIYSDADKNTRACKNLVNRFINAFNVNGCRVVLANDLKAYELAKKKTQFFDFVVSLTKDAYLVNKIESLGLVVINPYETFQISQDAADLAVHLEREGCKIPQMEILPVRKNYTGEQYLDLVVNKLIKAKFHYPFIIRKRYDQEFEQTVFYVDSKKELENTLSRCRGQLIAQQFYGNKDGVTLRALVIRRKIVATIQLKYYKSNVNGTTSSIWTKNKRAVTSDAQIMMKHAMASVNAKCAVIDFSYDKKMNCYINSINPIPDLLIFEKYYKKNFAIDVASLCVKDYKRMPRYRH